MNDDEIKESIEKLRPWWHYFKLPNGIEITRDDPDGSNDMTHPETKWHLTEPFIPKDLMGMKCLDIGSNSGFFSFKLAQRGADVLGIDVKRLHINQANFLKTLLLTEEEQARCKFTQMDMMGIEDEFDLILFMGVYYHLPRHQDALPFLYQNLKVGGALLFETAIEDKCRWSDNNSPYSSSIFVPTEWYCRDDIRLSQFHYMGGWEYNMAKAGQRRMYLLRK